MLDAKTYLSRAYRLETKINADIEHIQRLRELATKATTSMTATRTSGATSRSKIEDCVCQIIDLQNDTQKDIACLMAVKREIQTTIAGVSDKKLNALLTMRYLNYDTWSYIAHKLYYSERWIHKLHAAALQQIAGIINCSL